VKQSGVIRTVVVDCEQCLKEVTFEHDPAATGGSDIPEGWIEIYEGPPFRNTYQFCTPECFLAWHKRDKYERLAHYHERMRAKQEANGTAD
jgi:hypothetical protein